MEWEFPTVNNRTMILGSTGSGKTNQFLWLLLYQPFHMQPYVIFDYKRDEHIAKIDRARQIGLNELPRYPGLYVVRPMPDTDDDAVLGWLRAAWAKRNIGLCFDEALMLPQHGGALQSVFVQGRSLKIPILCLSQRPVDLHRTAFSEASYISIFQLNDARDYETVRKWVPRFQREWVENLPEHNSIWYVQRTRKTYHMAPVPNWETLPERINARLPSRIYFI